jgi:CPA2 family monovalent cation:H+ antiporter-2
MAAADASLYTEGLVLLCGAIVAAPLFKKIGLGTVLGYLAAGIVIGPCCASSPMERRSCILRNSA